MTPKIWHLLGVGLSVVGLFGAWHAAFGQKPVQRVETGRDAKLDRSVSEYANGMLTEGMRTFRFDTFGSEDFWGGKLKLHRAIEGEKNGGTGPGLSPKKALELGLKVDMDAVPEKVAAGIKSGKVDLNDPANTLALLKANAVLGVTGFFEKDGNSLKAVGIQCALCHSNVDDAFMPGIGRRLDGWPNRDLDIGAIAALAPDLKPFVDMLQVSEADVKKVITAWGVQSRGISKTKMIASRKSFPLCIFTSWRYPHRSHRVVASTAPLRSGEKKSSMTKPSAPHVTCRPSLPSQDGICIRPRKLALTIFRPCGHPTGDTAPRLCERYGTRRKYTKVASTTMDVSQR
jgi:hypothetical protein